MRSLRHSFLAVILLTGCTTQPVKEVSLLVAYDRGLKLEPCRCKVIPRGGILRESEEASRLAKTEETASTVIPLSAGTSFVPLAGDFSAAELATYRRKAIYTARALRLLGTRAVALSMEDFVLGIASLREAEKATGARFVAANLVDQSGASPFAPFIRVKGGVREIIIVGLAARRLNLRGATVSEVTWTPAEVALSRIVSQIDPSRELVVVLSNLERTEIAMLSESFPGVAAWLGGTQGNPHGSYAEQYSTQTLIAAPQIQAGTLLHLRISLEGNGWYSEKIADAAKKMLLRNGVHPDDRERIRAIASVPEKGSRAYKLEEVSLAGQAGGERGDALELLEEKRRVWEEEKLSDFE